MKKLFQKGILLLTSFFLTSCSNPFFGGGEGSSISEVTHVYDDKSGNTIVTIRFVDEDLEPVTFVIPRGITGQDGNGIRNIKAEPSMDNKSITLTISFTDPDKEDFVLEVPVFEGKGVKQVDVGEDENGNTTIQFSYTDNTQGELITIPKGKDGTGIKSITATEPDTFGNITITITLDDEDETQTTFQIKNGAGVKTISVDPTNTDDTKYALIIEYTDGFKETVTFDKPDSNRWYVGVSDPNTNLTLTNAHEGDFYLNKSNGNVYQLSVTGEWDYLFCMKADSSTSADVYYDVTFDANGGKAIVGGTEVTAWFTSVKEGKTIDLALLKSPVKEGYTFKGWYTDLNNINAGQFTDLTPVTKDLNLYARYEENI